MPKQRNVPGETILVVEDEPDTLESVVLTLQAAFPEGHILRAHNGVDGLHQMEGDHVDVIVSDYKMPGMDGVRFLEEADRLFPDTPRILMTAYSELDLLVRAINDAHILTFLPKPFTADDLTKAVQTALDRRPAPARNPGARRVRPTATVSPRAARDDE